MNHHLAPLRLNVGFITKQPFGYSRVFEFDFKQIRLEPDLELDELKGSADISHTPQGLLVQVDLQVILKIECVRCLDPVPLKLNTKFVELYAIPKRSTAGLEPILPENGYIDLGPISREYILLDIPINPICQPDCKGLCPICGEKLNQNDHNHKENEVDPRMSILKKLISDKPFDGE